MSASLTYDVAVIGGGPGGSGTATHLARAGLRVALFEREVFPRFHVGESLMPAAMLLLDRLGVRSRIEASGFQIKYGAQFFDHESGRSTLFYFLPGMAWPNYSYQVPRAQFDDIKITVARGRRARPATPAPEPMFTGHEEPRLSLWAVRGAEDRSDAGRVRQAPGAAEGAWRRERQRRCSSPQAAVAHRPRLGLVRSTDPSIPTQSCLPSSLQKPGHRRRSR